MDTIKDHDHFGFAQRNELQFVAACYPQYWDFLFRLERYFP